MQVPSVKFNPNDRPEFIKDLRKKVNNHFTENNISKFANTTMKIKTIFMISLYLIPLGFVLSGTLSNHWIIFGAFMLMSLGMSGIGLSVMHDANHGSYSKKAWVNKGLGFMLNVIGGSHVTWKIQHNVLHHSFTNIHEHDEDIEIAIMRFSPTAPFNKSYRFQAFYAPFLYGFMTIFKMVAKDFQQIYRFHKQNLLVGQGLTLRQAIIEVIWHKILYLTIALVLPIMILPIPWWETLAFFFVMHFFCGLFLALVFQPAHVIGETDFYKVSDEGSVENNWAIHQMLTTANFANGSTFFSWFVGGLNYQIEHHLFPNICHVHYKGISQIVRDTAKEYGIPYHHHKTFYTALKSHFSLLNKLGTGEWDKTMPAIEPSIKLSKAA